jgi:hypothetical protein
LLAKVLVGITALVGMHWLRMMGFGEFTMSVKKHMFVTWFMTGYDKGPAITALSVTTGPGGGLSSASRKKALSDTSPPFRRKWKA